MKRYRWNRSKFLQNLMEFLTMLALVGMFLWLTYEWIMNA